MARSLILIKHRAPYRDPVLRVLERDGDVDSISLFDNDVRHDWAGFVRDHKALFGAAGNSRLLWRFVFGREYGTVMWPAYHPWWITLPIFVSALTGKRYAITSDTKEENGNPFSRMVKRFIFRRAAFIWTPGQAGRRYLHERMGVSDNQIVEGLFTVDRDEVTAGCSEVTGKCERFLMVGNDIPGRRIDTLVEGFRKWRTGNRQLTVCGKGCGKFTGDGVIGLEGVRWTELSALYAQADVYVHNGMEQYSTAVQIAAMRGVPIICSRAVGIVADFRNPERCMVLVDDWQSTAAWSTAFAKMSAKTNEERRMMGECARVESAVFDIGKTAKEVKRHLNVERDE